jgi:hypothetical protein
MVKKTKDLIKFLPFEEEFKKNLLEVYDTLEPEKKYNIGMVLWAAYDTIFQMKLKRNMVIAFGEAYEERERLDAKLYNRVRDLTEKEMNQVSAEDIKETELDVARDKPADIFKAAEEPKQSN